MSGQARDMRVSMARSGPMARAGVPYLWLGAIIIIGLLFRLWLWWRVPMHQPANDEVEYLQVARDLISGRGWVFYDRYLWLRAPLYPLFLAGSLLLSGEDLRWAALPNIALSTLTIPLFYLLGRAVVLPAEPRPEDAGRASRAGLFAAAVCAVLMPFATFASLWMSETLFTALFTGGLVLLLRWHRRPSLTTAAGAGLAFGLAILTRSAPLAAVPLLMLWMAWTGRRHGATWGCLLSAAACLLAILLVIAPWTIRNWLAYGHFIPVETGLSFNLWVFNEPREGVTAIYRTLESIENPGERAAYATAKGLARLREDPSIVLRRIQTNWYYLWVINPIEDRFLQESYYQDVPGDLFVLAMLLDDGLYLLIAASALAGLLLMPRLAARPLLVGWMVYFIAVTLLTHGEGRYRQFLFPALIPLAAACWSAGWWGRAAPARRVAAVGVALLALLPLRSYPYDWAHANLGRAWFEAAGDRAMRRGDYGAAQRAYQQGATSDPMSADILLKTGLAFDRAGDLESALQAYGKAAGLKPSYIAPSARLGDALRRAGRDQEARRAFQGFYSDPRQIADWAWQHVTSSPEQLLEIGDGLDAGFVQGMYNGETIDDRRVRWTSGQARLRLAAYEGGTIIRLRLAAPRPDGRPVIARLCVVGGRCQVIAAGAEWRTVNLHVPPSCATGEPCNTEQPIVELAIFSPTFAPVNTMLAQAQEEPAAADTRRLGLMLDYAVSLPLDAAERTMPHDETRTQ